MPAPYTHTIRVRYGECDQQGVVFNANWLAYFDVVVTEVWRERVRDYKEMIASGTDMVVAEANVRYLGLAGFDDEVELAYEVVRLGETSVTSRIRASVDGSPVVEGRMRHVFIDPDTKRKKPMPDDIRAGLESLLAEDAEPAAAPSA